MLSPNIYLFLLSSLYAFLLMVVSVIIFDRFKKKVRLTKSSVVLIFFFALLIRLFAVVFFPFASGSDVSSFLWAAHRILDGKDIYWALSVRYYYAFIPTFALIAAGLLKISFISKIPILILIKLLIIIFDSLIAVLIFIVNRDFRSSLVYAVSSIPVVVGAYLGQFDSIPLFFSVLGVYFFSLKRSFSSIASFGFGAAFKPWPLIFTLPILMIGKNIFEKLKGLIFLLIPLGSVVAIYKLIIPSGNVLIMIGAIALYESVLGWWGLSIVFQKVSQVFKIPIFLEITGIVSKMLAIGIIFYIYRKFAKTNIFTITKLIILVIYIFSLGFAIQYLLWIFPFALITKDRLTKYYLVFVGSYFILFGIFRLLNYNFDPPMTPDILYVPLTFLLWLLFLFWGNRELRLYI